MGVLRRWDEPSDECSDEPDWCEHEAMAGPLAGAVRPFSARSEMYCGDDAAAIERWIDAARCSPPEVVRSLLLVLIRRAGAEGGWSHDTIRRVHGLRRLSFRLPACDAAYVLRTAARLPDSWSASGVLAAAAAMAARADAPDDPTLAQALAEMTESIHLREYVPAIDLRKIMRSLSLLRPRPGEGTAVDMTVIAAVDGWSAVVLAELAGWDGPAHPVNVLLHQLRSASPAKATKKWLARATELLACPDQRRVLRMLLEAAASADGVTAPDRYGWGLVNLVVSGRNADLVRAASLAAAVIDEDWVVPALSAIARRAIHGAGECGYIESATVPQACIGSLGVIGSDEAIGCLQELLGTTRDARARKQIGGALAGAARRAGLRPGEIAERIVTSAGLDRHGERIVAAGGVTAQVRIADDWKVSTRWRGRQGWVQRAPAGAAVAEQAVGAAVREVGAALAQERRRLEGLLAQDRDWPAGTWRALYCEHPVTGAISRGLLWEFRSGAGTRMTAMPAAGGRLTTLDGAADAPEEGTVRLWHPVWAGTDEIAAWRDALAAAGRRQPFEQASRAAYRLTLAERESSTHTGRFAARILRYQEAFALVRERGWVTNYLDACDGGLDGLALHDFPDAGLTAVLEHQAIGCQAGDLQVELCRTGRVFFCRSGDRSLTPVRLAKVPELVFSEAMRDVDILVTTCGTRRR